MATQIFTHRGLEPGNPDFYFAESSYEAFHDQLNRGYGLEFDITFSKDNVPFVFHDSSLARISNGADMRLYAELHSDEIAKIRIASKGVNPPCRLVKFDDLLEILFSSPPSVTHAFHYKAKYQTQESIKIVSEILAKHEGALKNLLVFDLLPESAKQLHSQFDALNLAASVADPFDIQRFNAITGGTLLSVTEAIAHRGCYNWMWLDEWDRKSADGLTKCFYSPATFAALRDAGFKLALVTPELHATSPGLLADESHPDGISVSNLKARLPDILRLRPDAVCTDYPEIVANFLGENPV